MKNLFNKDGDGGNVIRDVAGVGFLDDLMNEGLWRHGLECKEVELFWGEGEGYAVGVEEDAVAGFEGVFKGLNFEFVAFSEALGEAVVVVGGNIDVRVGGLGFDLLSHGVVLG